MDKKLVENFATWHVSIFFCCKLGPQLIFQLHTAQVSVHLVFLYNLQTTYKGCNFVDRPIFLCCYAYYHNYDASWKIKISKENWPVD